jgi:putative ABC transport system substrate-binding protein
MRRREFVSLFGAAAPIWAPVVGAQETRSPVIGFFGASGANVVAMTAFRQGLSETGYVDGQNLTIEYRWADGHYEQLPVLASEFVLRGVNLILATGSNLALSPRKLPPRRSRSFSSRAVTRWQAGWSPVWPGPEVT